MVGKSRPVFLSPHYDDVALSCGGTVAKLADAGQRPLILTVFGGEPAGSLSPFALKMHQDWGLDPADAIQQRRQEDTCAAEILGAHSAWLDIPDAIYRSGHYQSDDELFGNIHPEEARLSIDVRDEIHEFLETRDVEVSTFYCPLGIGNHVDHQLLIAASRSLTYRGFQVLAYEDFPYSGDPGADFDAVASVRSGNSPTVCNLDNRYLDRRVQAIRCYTSQLEVVFRFQGRDAEEATRRFAMRCGNGAPAERFWPL